MGTWQNENALDDWLGDISYDDWEERATEQAARRRGRRISLNRPFATRRRVWDLGARIRARMTGMASPETAAGLGILA